MTHGNKPARRSGDLYLFPQVASCVVNVCKTDAHGLEVRTVFARNPATQHGETHGRAIMRRPHAMVRASNVTVIRAQSKRVVRPRVARPSRDAPELALITVPCMTRIESAKILNTWEEYPLTVLSGNKHVPSIVLAKELAPTACARLANGSEEVVVDVLATQHEWLDSAAESAIIMSRQGIVTRVWHYDRASGSCEERRATVYSSIDPQTLDGIKTDD